MEKKKVKNKFDLYSGDERINSLLLLSVLNKFDKMPSLMEYTTILELLLDEKSCKFSQLQISAYKDFARVGLINLSDDNTLSNDKNPILHRTKKQ